MGTTTIEINHVRSRSPSVGSHEDDLHDGVPVSPVEISPQYSVIQAQSQSGSSSHPGESQYVHLSYPHEVPEGADVDPSESASRVDPHERHPDRLSRSNSARRAPARRQTATREGRPRLRQPAESPTESGDSTEEFLRERDYPPGMPRPQSYYGPNGYTHSSSSGSYGYPPVHPPSNQMIPMPYQPPPHPYPHPYPQTPNPPPMGYPPSQMNYQPQFAPHPQSHISSPYSSPYGPPSVMQYGAPTSGYFPQQYPPAYPPQQYPTPQYMPPYAQQQMMQMPQFVDAYRVQSPTHFGAPSSGAAPASATSPNPDIGKAEQEEIIKRFDALMKAQKDERRDSELNKEQALKQAAEQVKAEAAAAAERATTEARIREEARLEAMRAYEEKARAAADLAAREQQIRKEAAEEALKAAAEEARAKADRAALEKRIADDAAAAAKTTAEKKAAEAAAAVEEEAKKAQKEAEKKLKEAEDAAAQAKSDAEAAEKKAADATVPVKKKPVRFKDAIGRNYNFPWERCSRWRDMEGLINQAFAHIENLAEHVHHGHYDLLGPDKEIIMPQYWDSTIEPDMHITMKLWPLPEPDPDVVTPPIDVGNVLSLDDILNGDARSATSKKKKKPRGPGALGMWMMGGAQPRSRSVKGDKRPH